MGAQQSAAEKKGSSLIKKLSSHELGHWKEEWGHVSKESTSGHVDQHKFIQFYQKTFGKEPEELLDLYNMMDIDKNGRVSFAEFVLFHKRESLVSLSEEDYVKVMFQLFDNDGNGEVTRDELKNGFVVLLKLKGKNLSDQATKIEMSIKHIFQIADKNHDGKVTMNEVLAALKTNHELFMYLWID